MNVCVYECIICLLYIANLPEVVAHRLPLDPMVFQSGQEEHSLSAEDAIHQIDVESIIHHHGFDADVELIFEQQQLWLPSPAALLLLEREAVLADCRMQFM